MVKILAALPEDLVWTPAPMSGNNTQLLMTPALVDLTTSSGFHR